MRGKVSISLGNFLKKYDVMETLEIAKNVGAEAVDFDLAPQDFRKEDSIFSKSEDEICEYYTKVKKKADELGLEIGQTHGFFPPVRETDEEHNRIIVPKISRLDCMATKILGAPICVFHPAGTLSNRTASPEFMRERTFEFISNTLGYAKEFDIKFGLETVGSNYDLDNTIDFFGNFDEFNKLYFRVAAIEEYKDNFTCCVDTGHSNMAVQFGHPKPSDLIRKMGQNVGALHLHDNNGYMDQHALIGMGNIDWVDVFDALYEIGYKGNYNSESSFYAKGHSLISAAEFTVNTIKKFLSRYNFD